MTCVLTRKCSASGWSCCRRSDCRIESRFRNSSIGTRSSAATWLHHRSTALASQRLRLEVGQRGRPEPEMCASSCEMVNTWAALLSAPLTNTTDCVRVSECETPELLGIQLAVCVGTDDPADHHENASGFGVLPEPSQGIVPGAAASAGLSSPVEGLTHLGCDLADGGFDGGLTHERDRRLAVQELMVAIPLLAPLAGVDHIEQISRHDIAVPADGTIADRPEIRDGNSLNWRLLKKHEPNRRVRLASELLELLDRRDGCTREPFLISAGTAAPTSRRRSRTVPAPTPRPAVGPRPGHSRLSTSPSKLRASLIRPYSDGATRNHAVCLARRFLAGLVGWPARIRSNNTDAGSSDGS